MGTERGRVELAVDPEGRQVGVFERLLVSAALVLVVALIYQFIVGGIKIEIAGGRLIVDTSGFVYWWQVFTGAVTPPK